MIKQTINKLNYKDRFDFNMLSETLADAKVNQPDNANQCLGAQGDSTNVI